MTLAFLAGRKGFLKVTGATIQAALDRGHTVVLLWDPAETKPGESVRETELAGAWPKARVITWARGTPLAPALRAEGVRALVSPSMATALRTFCREGESDALRAAGIRLYSVDYGLDTINYDPASYRSVDVTFYATGWQRERHWATRAEDFAAVGDPATLTERSAVVGSTMLDQLATVDRTAVRKRYGLPENTPIVLFLSLKMAVPDPWRRLVWGNAWRGVRAVQAVAAGRAAWVPEILRSHGYRDLVAAIRRLCDRSGAALVVKSREKNRDPRFLRRLGDAFVFDEDVYPYTSMALMAVADLCVHFQSAGVLEASFAGVPSVSVRVSHEHLANPSDHASAYTSYTELFNARPGSLQNFSGVVESVTPAEAIARFDAASLKDFRVDAEARRRYVEQFIGFDDMRASERVLDVIEAVGP
jgi:hypothetical protein